MVINVYLYHLSAIVAKMNDDWRSCIKSLLVNIWLTMSIHMIVLIWPDLGNTLGLCVTSTRRPMMDENVVWFTACKINRCVFWSACTPFCSWNNLWTPSCGVRPRRVAWKRGIDSLVLNANTSSISALSWREQILKREGTVL